MALLPIKINSKWLVIAAISILLLVGFSPAFLLTGSGTNTKEYLYTGGHSDWGALLGHIELSDTDYAVGWKPGATPRSEKFIVAEEPEWGIERDSYVQIGGKVVNSYLGITDAGLADLQCTYYEWYVNDVKIKTSAKQTGGVDAETDQKTNYWALLPVISSVTSGTVFEQNDKIYIGESSAETTKTGVSMLEVKLIGDIRFYTLDFQHPLGSWSAVEKVVLSSDAARLHSGSAILKMTDPYQKNYMVGTDASFYVETGYTHDQGWDLKLVPPEESGEKTITIKELSDNFRGTIKYKIPENWYTLGGDNVVKVELWNPLFNEAVEEFFTIDDYEKMPTMISARADKTSVTTGDTVTLTMSAKSNNITGAPIESFLLYVYYGSVSSQPGADSAYIFNERYVTATAKGNGTYSASIDFQTSVTANVVCEITARDVDGRHSDTMYVQISSTEEGGEVGPPSPEDPGEFPFVWNIYAVAAMLIGAALSVIVLFVYRGLSITPDKLIIIVLILAITAIAVFLLGTDPTLSEVVLF